MTEDKELVTKEDLEKALTELAAEEQASSNIKKAKKATNAKLEDEEDTDDESEEHEGSESEEKESGEEEEEQESYKAVKGGFHKMKKGQRADAKIYKKVIKGDKEEYEEMSEKEIQGMKEANGGDDKLKAGKDKMKKGEEIELLFKSLESSMITVRENVDTKFKSVGTILKSLMEQNELLTNKIEEMSKQTQGRKSVGVGYLDRFEKGEKEEANTLSLTKDKAAILSLMESASNLQKGQNVDWDMADAMSEYEINSTIKNTIALKLEKATGIKISK